MLVSGREELSCEGVELASSFAVDAAASDPQRRLVPHGWDGVALQGVVRIKM